MDGKIPFSRQDYLWRMAQWPSSRTLVAKSIWSLEQEEFTSPQFSPDWKLYYAKSYIFHCFRTGVVSLCGDWCKLVTSSARGAEQLRPMKYCKMSRVLKVHHSANSEWPVDSRVILKRFLPSEQRRSELSRTFLGRLPPSLDQKAWQCDRSCMDTMKDWNCK